MTEALRPIGTEFQVEFHSVEVANTASPNGSIITYRVVAHVKCDDSRGGVTVEEEIIPVKIEGIKDDWRW